MAQALERDHADTDEILFELEALEWTAANRLEVRGCWFGVRGRRFVRPTLTLLGDGHESRSLADLEHKPWSAEDGELWTAAFVCEQDKAGAASELELAVAPGIAITLPAPALAPVQRDGGANARPDPDSVVLTTHREAKAPAVLELRAGLERSQAENRRLKKELERAASLRTEAKSALARRDAAVNKLDAVLRERDAAMTQAERAVTERDEALAALEQAQRERADAVERAARERADAVKRATRDRDEALAAATRAARERDEALAGHRAAEARISRVKAAAQAQLAQLRDQLDEQRVDLHSAGHRAVPLPSAPQPHATGVSSPRSQALALAFASREFVLIRRALAVLVLLAVVVALALMIQSP